MSGISFERTLGSFHIRRQNVIREKVNCVHNIRKCSLYDPEGNERKETDSGGDGGDGGGDGGDGGGDGGGGIHRGGFYIYNTRMFLNF